MITELRYSNTNTYIIHGKYGDLLWDTGWAGTFPLFCKALGEKKLKLQDIRCLMISHFHPDHMGIAQEIADMGVQIVAADVQRKYIHISDSIFEREGNRAFIPICDEKVKFISIADSREFLRELGIHGELIHTPGHSEDSISLWLDKERALLVGDLNPLYELEMHKGTQIAESWEKLLAMKPKKIYYGHAKTAEIGKQFYRFYGNDDDRYALVKTIMKLTDKGCSTEEIKAKTGADTVFIQDVVRMYVTHRGVSVQGILDRIEIKGM
ncbi:MAG: MBL fold metallo-hydrolase [Ruminococcus sp.]|nr:MBL fold metallo-hydrolase [Ruminococcus sp.]